MGGGERQAERDAVGRGAATRQRQAAEVEGLGGLVGGRGKAAKSPEEMRERRRRTGSWVSVDVGRRGSCRPTKPAATQRKKAMRAMATRSTASGLITYQSRYGDAPGTPWWSSLPVVETLRRRKAKE